MFCVKVQNYGYMTVSLLSRENRVAYIKREFTVYNKKVLPKPWARDKGKKIYRDSRSSGFGILKEVKNVVKNS